MVKFTQFYKAILLLSSIIIIPAADEIEFSGEQDGTYGKAEYIAEKNIVVKKGQTLTFAPGSIIRFNRFSGIVVNGNLVCRGTVAEPIVFTSINDRPIADREEDPQPFNWNGIEIKEPADSVVIHNVRISYSTFGLKVPKSIKHFSLENTVFNDNGSANLTIGDSAITTVDNEPFTLVVDTVPAKPELAPEKTGQESSSRKLTWRTPVRIGLGSLALVGGAMGIGFYAKAKKLHDNYNASDASTVVQNREDRDKAHTISKVGTVLGIIGLSGLTITLFF